MQAVYVSGDDLRSLDWNLYARLSPGGIVGQKSDNDQSQRRRSV